MNLFIPTTWNITIKYYVGGKLIRKEWRKKCSSRIKKQPDAALLRM